MSEQMETVRWMADNFAEIKGELGEIRGEMSAGLRDLSRRQAAIEERLSSGKARSWLERLSGLPWRALVSLVIGTLLLITGHMTLEQWRAWLTAAVH